MLNTVYRLVAPRRFEVAFNDIDLNSDSMIKLKLILKNKDNEDNVINNDNNNNNNNNDNNDNNNND